MSWEKLVVTGKYLDGITIAIVASSSKDRGKMRCVVRVGRQIAERSGLPFADKGRVDVYVGRAADAGRMKITTHPEGGYVAHPEGRKGAIKICVPPPEGAPTEFGATATEWAVEDGGGITFAVPWHVRAADREVEEVIEALRILEKVTINPLDPSTAPPTLDAIEEAARPVPPLAHALAEIAAKADKPASVPKQHVYADSPSGEATKAFIHNGKTARLTETEYAVAHRLYKVMKKGVRGQFLDFSVISSLAKTKDIAVLHAFMTRLTAKAEAVGLAICVQKGRGWWMAEVKS